MEHFVYIILSKSADKYYVGETCNIQERVHQHNSAYYDSAFSKQAKDWELFWSLKCNSRSQALKIEKHIKKMRNRKFYENLVKFSEISQKLLERFPS